MVEGILTLEACSIMNKDLKKRNLSVGQIGDYDFPTMRKEETRPYTKILLGYFFKKVMTRDDLEDRRKRLKERPLIYPITKWYDPDRILRHFDIYLRLFPPKTENSSN